MKKMMRFVGTRRPLALLITCHLSLVTLLTLSCAHPALAQKSSDVRKSGPQVVKAFRPIVAKPSECTVRVRCDERDVALGTIVGADGWILTKASDLNATPIVRLKGEDLDARIVGVHEAHDLALLKVEAKGLTPVEWRPSKEVPVGFWAITVGPDEQPVAVGVVSVGMRNVPNPKGGWFPINPTGGFLGISLDPDESTAKIAEKYLTKGAKVFVEGRLATRKWQDREGNDRYTTQIELSPYTGTLTFLDSRKSSSDEARGSDRGGSGSDVPTGDSLDDEITF